MTKFGFNRKLRPVRIACGAAIILSLTSLFGCSKSDISSGSATNAKYQLGTILSFGKDGDSERFRTSGWSHTEDQQTWTDGNVALLEFSGLPPSQALTLTMTLVGLTKPPELPAQPVTVFANGKQIADWQVSDKHQYTASIPADIVDQTGKLRLEFRMPKATSSKSLGINEDSRTLGVAVTDIVIDKAH